MEPDAPSMWTFRPRCARKRSTVTSEKREQSDCANLRIDILAYIELRGSSLGFPAARQERLTLMQAAIRQGLIEWNGAVGKFVLTTLGRERLAAHRHEMAISV